MKSSEEKLAAEKQISPGDIASITVPEIPETGKNLRRIKARLSLVIIIDKRGRKRKRFFKTRARPNRKSNGTFFI